MVAKRRTRRHEREPDEQPRLGRDRAIARRCPVRVARRRRPAGRGQHCERSLQPGPRCAAGPAVQPQLQLTTAVIVRSALSSSSSRSGAAAGALACSRRRPAGAGDRRRRADRRDRRKGNRPPSPCPRSSSGGAGNDRSTPANLLAQDPAGALDELKRWGSTGSTSTCIWADIAPDPTSRVTPDFDATDPAAYPAAGWASSTRSSAMPRPAASGVDLALSRPRRAGPRARGRPTPAATSP